MDRERLVHNFTYHPPKADNIWKFEALRREARNLALLIDNYVPDSREKSVAITNLEQAIFWANAGLARNLAPSVDAIAGAMGRELKDSPDYPANIVPPMPDKAREAVENIQTLLAETEGCDGYCKCKRS